MNGHTPVKLPKGQLPVRSEGRRLVIDGGFCGAYRKSTGIAGYTLIDDANGTRLVAHGDFPGLSAVLDEGADMAHEEQVLVKHERPQQIGETPGTKRRLSAYPESQEDNDWAAKRTAQVEALVQDWARNL